MIYFKTNEFRIFEDYFLANLEHMFLLFYSFIPSFSAHSRIIGLIGRLSEYHPDCIEKNKVDAGNIMDLFFKVLEDQQT